jgi:eukaryotic-like serine/threonine-protein kinase
MNQRVESIFTDEQIDEVLDNFERVWSRDAGFLEDFVASESLGNAVMALAELVRADVDRRYAASVEVDLTGYFKTFPALRSHKGSALAIAYEDFRSRSSRGLSLPANRWNWISGIQEAEWFKSLQEAVEGTKFFPQASQTPVAACNIEPRVGETFGEFQLLSLLGEGAFSKVYLATQSSLAGRYVALKVVTQTLDEPTHLARLQHTGIVPLYSVHRIGSYSALCMPYYGSATLADWLGEQSVASERNGQSLVTTVQAALNNVTCKDVSAQSDQTTSSLAQEADRIRVWNSAGSQLLQRLRNLDSKKFLLWIARHVAAGLAHAHERGIIHGDLKPANILLRNDGEPALIDFNLSKDSELKQPSWVGGTLPYMSPEQLKLMLGQRFQTSTRSDIFSFGLILFEVIENKLPFPAPLSAAEIDIAAAIAVRSTPIRFTNNHTSAGLRAIVVKCLQFEPENRYASASELLEDLDRETANLPLGHASEGLLTSRVPKLIRRYPRVFATVPVALFCFSIVAISAVLANHWRRSSRTFSAQSQLSIFENQARRQLPQLLGEKSNLAPRLANTVTLVKDYIGAPQNDLSRSANLSWLSAAERNRAENLIFDYCLSSAAIASETWHTLSHAEQASVRQLLDLCALVSERAKQSPIHANLQQISSGRVLAVNSSELQQLQPVEELLLARLSPRQDHHKALAVISRISELSRPDLSVFANLYWLTAGDAESQLGQYEAAKLCYELAISAAPDAAVSYAQRAKLLVSVKDYRSAELDYSNAIKRSPEYVAYYVDRALVRKLLLDFKGSREDLDHAMELAPSSNRIALIRAQINQLLGNTEAVRDDMKLAMTSEPKNVEDWVSRGLAQLPRFPDRALRDLKAAEALAPESVVVLQNLAHVHSEYLKDAPAAIAALDKIIAADANNEMARGGRCVLLARQGKVTASLQDVEWLYQLGDRAMPATLYQIGSAHALLAEKNEPSQVAAIRYVAKALKRNYGGELLDTDSDLDLIRKSPDFIALNTASKLALENPQSTAQPRENKNCE